MKRLSSAVWIAAALLTGAACAPTPNPAAPSWGYYPPAIPPGFQPPPAPPPASPPAAPPAAQPAPPETAPADRPKVAVLPIQDDRLFRAERAELRRALGNRLALLAPNHAILPLADVDAKLRPVSATTGARCAFQGEPPEKRAQDSGWLTTAVLHVSGSRGRGEELWVRITGWHNADLMTWLAPWDPKLDLMNRYRAAIAALTPHEDALGLGGLGVAGSDKGALQEGPITVCEARHFGACDATSSAWKDKAGELGACFANEDDAEAEVLIQGDAPPALCEMIDLNETEGPLAQREACLCRVLTGSSGMSAKPGRRAVRVRFEAPELAQKPRPELRVIEASTNLSSDADYHSIRTERDGKTHYEPMYRLVTDNIDALAAPLARCAMPGGQIVVAGIDVREDGAVAAGRVLSGLQKKPDIACVEKALGRGAFTCSQDGKAAKVKIAITWPEKAPTPAPGPRGR